MKKQRRKNGRIIWGVIVSALAIFIWRLDITNWTRLDIDKLRNYQQTAILYDGKDSEIGILASAQHRIQISLNDIPQSVRNAFLAAEDARFYEHYGIDPWRIGGALVANIRIGGYAQGASTITQQLIKLTHLSGEKSMSRKAQEAWLALQLERQMEKDEILEIYLNTVYFGGAGSGVGAYGIEAASNTFFQKSAKELSISEGALLAAVIKSPSGYAPTIHPEKAIARRNSILDAMAEYNFIDMETAQKAKNEPLGLNVADMEDIPFGWYVDAALAEAEKLLDVSADEVLTGGYRIYTCLDPEAQKTAESLFENGGNFPDPAADGTPVQAAFVALDADSGQVIALIGGRNYGMRRGLNRATQIARQPGSAIKPVSTYAAAVDGAGFVPTSILLDEQREFGDGYMPGNAGGNYYGKVTMREALSRSLNVATLDLAEIVGINAVRVYAQRLGLPVDAADQNLSLALGSMTYGVSPLELANAYQPLANKGNFHKAYLIRRIENNKGEIVYSYSKETERVLSEESAFILTSMLETAADSGSAKALASVPFAVAGKTGTVEMPSSNGNRDIWTVAYTPSVVVSVWMGFDMPDEMHALPEGTGGSGYPARFAAKFLSATEDFLYGGDFTIPHGITRVYIDKKALDELKAILLATELTPPEYRIKEVFTAGKVPSSVSPYWNIPQKVMDLEVVLNKAEKPEIRFTAPEDGVEYLIMRTEDGNRKIIASLTGEKGERISYVDETIVSSKAETAYSVLPRHAALYEMGRLVVGEESEAVSPQKNRKQSLLMEWFKN